MSSYTLYTIVVFRASVSWKWTQVRPFLNVCKKNGRNKSIFSAISKKWCPNLKMVVGKAISLFILKKYISADIVLQTINTIYGLIFFLPQKTPTLASNIQMFFFIFYFDGLTELISIKNTRYKHLLIEIQICMFNCWGVQWPAIKYGNEKIKKNKTWNFFFSEFPP